MTGVREVECRFCGSIFPLQKAMKVDMESGEYRYACPGCAQKWIKGPK